MLAVGAHIDHPTASSLIKVGHPTNLTSPSLWALSVAKPKQTSQSDSWSGARIRTSSVNSHCGRQEPQLILRFAACGGLNSGRSIQGRTEGAGKMAPKSGGGSPKFDRIRSHRALIWTRLPRLSMWRRRISQSRTTGPGGGPDPLNHFLSKSGPSPDLCSVDPLLQTRGRCPDHPRQPHQGPLGS